MADDAARHARQVGMLPNPLAASPIPGLNQVREARGDDLLRPGGEAGVRHQARCRDSGPHRLRGSKVPDLSGLDCAKPPDAARR